MRCGWLCGLSRGNPPPTVVLTHPTALLIQERFQGLGNAFFRGADACVIVYDVTNEQSFLRLEEWKEAFIEQAGLRDATSFPFMILGNKIDERNRVIPLKRAEKWCAEHGACCERGSSADLSAGAVPRCLLVLVCD